MSKLTCVIRFYLWLSNFKTKHMGYIQAAPCYLHPTQQNGLAAHFNLSLRNGGKALYWGCKYEWFNICLVSLMLIKWQKLIWICNAKLFPAAALVIFYIDILIDMQWQLTTIFWKVTRDGQLDARSVCKAHIPWINIYFKSIPEHQAIVQTASLGEFGWI